MRRFKRISWHAESAASADVASLLPPSASAAAAAAVREHPVNAAAVVWTYSTWASDPIRGVRGVADLARFLGISAELRAVQIRDLISRTGTSIGDVEIIKGVY